MPMQCQKKPSIIYLLHAEPSSCYARIESAVMLGEYYYAHMIKGLQSSWFYKCSLTKKNCWGKPVVISVSEFTPHLITASLKKRSNFISLHFCPCICISLAVVFPAWLCGLGQVVAQNIVFFSPTGRLLRRILLSGKSLSWGPSSEIWNPFTVVMFPNVSLSKGDGLAITKLTQIQGCCVLGGA